MTPLSATVLAGAALALVVALNLLISGLGLTVYACHAGIINILFGDL